MRWPSSVKSEEERDDGIFVARRKLQDSTLQLAV